LIKETVIKMTYLWRIPDSYPESLIGEYVRISSPDRFLFRQGQAVPDELGVPVVKFAAPLAKLLPYSCLPNSGMIPLINAELRDLLSRVATADIQLIKAKVYAQDGESDNFFILNPASKIVGIDRDKSSFNFVPGTQKIMSFKRLSYINDCLGSHMLARDADYLSHLLVSDELVELLKGRGLLGVEFLRAEEIDW
jgi:hypothetical protein